MDTLASPACYCCLFIIAVVSARHRRPSFVSQVSTSATEMSVSALLQGVIPTVDKLLDYAYCMRHFLTCRLT